MAISAPTQTRVCNLKPAQPVFDKMSAVSQAIKQITTVQSKFDKMSAASRAIEQMKIAPPVFDKMAAISQTVDRVKFTPPVFDKMSAVSQAIESMSLRHGLSFELPEAGNFPVGELVKHLELDDVDKSLDFFSWTSKFIKQTELRYKEGLISKVVFTLLLGVVGGLISNFIYDKFFTQPQVHAADTYSQTNVIVNLSFPSNFVKRTSIVHNDAEVYVGRRSRSKVVGYLFNGDVVHIVETRKKWRRVIWVDEDGIELSGWVRAKYLRRAKPLGRHPLRKHSGQLFDYR